MVSQAFYHLTLTHLSNLIPSFAKARISPQATNYKKFEKAINLVIISGCLWQLG